MKKSQLILCLLPFYAFAYLAPAFAGSSVKGAVINVPGKIDKSVIVAVGKNSTAEQSSIKLQNLNMGGVVVNTDQGKQNVNVAVGNNAEATQASTKLGGKLRGAVVNTNLVDKKSLNSCLKISLSHPL